MFARVTTIQGTAENVEGAIEQYRKALEQVRAIAGNQGTFLLVDRGGGKVIGMALWESEESMADSREQSSQHRERAVEQAEGQIQSVEEYEVALWDVAA